MGKTPLQILIDESEGDNSNYIELLELERKIIIDAFNACAMEEVLNQKKYLNGQDYYNQKFNKVDY
jgi:hypothetical protein